MFRRVLWTAILSTMKRMAAFCLSRISCCVADNVRSPSLVRDAALQRLFYSQLQRKVALSAVQTSVQSAAKVCFPPFLRYVILLLGHQFDRREWLARAVCFVWRGRQVRGRQNVGGNRGFDWSVAVENDYNRACWESFMSTPCQRAYVFFRRVLSVKTHQCCSMSDLKFCEIKGLSPK